LLASISPADGKVREVVPLDELHTRDTCALRVADRGETPPVDIAKLMGVSLGLAELLQRHGLLKVEAALGKVRDERRGVTMSVEGLPDGRGPATLRKPRPPRLPRRQEQPKPRGGNRMEMRELMDRFVERLRRDGKQWRKLTREQVEALYGLDRVHPRYGDRPKPTVTSAAHAWGYRPRAASSDGRADALSGQSATGNKRKNEV
jgi:hypothetical protein